MGEPITVSHAGRYWYFADNLEPVEGADAVVRLWMALPFTRPGQTVELGRVSPEPTQICEDPFGGNRIACWEVREFPADGPLTFTVDFDVVATEVRSSFDPDSVEDYDRASAEYERYTRSEPWIEITSEIEAAARGIVGDETNPWRAAKRIFEWVVAEMAYEYPDMESRGAKVSFARRKGDCGEYSVVFAALCRAVGIPARTVICNWFTGLGHEWAEFLCPPHGWVPVDASLTVELRGRGEALGGEERLEKFLANRGIPPDDPDWLFGNLYANRLVVFVGTNVPAGDRTFAMMQPAGEVAHPMGFESHGCGEQVVHGGFYLFDEGHADPDRAREVAGKELAKAYFDVGLPDQAFEGFQRVVADEPKNSLAWFHLGQIHMGRADTSSAIAALSSCAEGDMGSIQPVLAALSLLLRGQCFDLEGRREEAIRDYEALIASGVDFQGVDAEARKHLEEPFRGE